MVLQGYKTVSNMNATAFNSLLPAIHKAIQKAWEKHYAPMLADEITKIADKHVLGRFQIAPGHSVKEVAEDRLCHRIALTNQANRATRYNYQILLEYYPYKGHWYIRVVAHNPQLTDGIFDSIPKLEPYNIEESNDKTQEARETWEAILLKEYKDKRPLATFFTPSLPLPVDPSSMQFPSVQQRAEWMAYVDESNTILSALAADGNIHPQEIIDYINEITLESKADPIHDIQIRKKTAELKMILPELTYQVVTAPLQDLQAGQPESTEEPQA